MPVTLSQPSLPVSSANALRNAPLAVVLFLCGPDDCAEPVKGKMGNGCKRDAISLITLQKCSTDFNAPSFM